MSEPNFTTIHQIDISVWEKRQLDITIYISAQTSFPTACPISPENYVFMKYTELQALIHTTAEPHSLHLHALH